MDDLERTGSPFDALRRQTANGWRWSARDLQEPADYAVWQNFRNVIEKAKNNCEKYGILDATFEQVAQLIDGNNLGPQERIDYLLNRRAAYMVFAECDGSKEAITQAKAYFVENTIKAEEDARLPGISDISDPRGMLAEFRMWEARDAQRNQLLMQRNQLLIEQTQKLILASERIEELEPKAAFADAVCATEGEVTLTQAAKGFGVQRSKLIKVLIGTDVLYRIGPERVLIPKEPWRVNRSFVVRSGYSQRRDGTRKFWQQSMFTPRGLENVFFHLRNHQFKIDWRSRQLGRPPARLLLEGGNPEEHGRLF